MTSAIAQFFLISHSASRFGLRCVNILTLVIETWLTFRRKAQKNQAFQALVAVAEVNPRRFPC